MRSAGRGGVVGLAGVGAARFKIRTTKPGPRVSSVTSRVSCGGASATPARVLPAPPGIFGWDKVAGHRRLLRECVAAIAVQHAAPAPLEASPYADAGTAKMNPYPQASAHAATGVHQPEGDPPARSSAETTCSSCKTATKRSRSRYHFRVDSTTARCGLGSAAKYARTAARVVGSCASRRAARRRYRLRARSCACAGRCPTAA